MSQYNRPDLNALGRLILDTISLPVLVTDRDLHLVFVNQALDIWNREFQWSAESPIGRPLFDVFAFLPERVKENYRQVLETGSPISSESNYDFGGKPLTVEVELLPIVEDGAVSHIVTLLRNITRERETQLALQQSEERFRLQFQAIPVPTYTWERRSGDFVLISCNSAAERMTDGGIVRLIGAKAGELYGPNSQIFGDMLACVSTQQTVQRELLYNMVSTGVEKFVRAYYVFIPPNQIQVHTIDLTADKRTEEQLRKAHQELETRIAERTGELRSANEQLTVERETLQRKNLLQQDLLDQIGESRRAAALQIQANIDRIVMPLFEHIRGKVEPRCDEYLGLIKSSLLEITSPLVSRLEQRFRQLTPQEVQICSLIRRGYSSKEIAGVRNSSVQTVLKQRKSIRKKLGLSGTDANLATFLSSVSVDSPEPQEAHRK